MSPKHSKLIFDSANKPVLQVSSTDLWSMNIRTAIALLDDTLLSLEAIEHYRCCLTIEFPDIVNSLSNVVATPQALQYLKNLAQNWPFIFHFAQRNNGTLTKLLASVSKSFDVSVNTIATNRTFIVDMDNIEVQIAGVCALMNLCEQQDIDGEIDRLKVDIAECYPQSVLIFHDSDIASDA